MKTLAESLTDYIATQLLFGGSESYTTQFAEPAFYAGAAAMAERFAAGEVLKVEAQPRWYAVKISDNRGTLITRHLAYSMQELRESLEIERGPFNDPYRMIMSVRVWVGGPTDPQF